MYQILENFHALWWPGDKATAAKNHMDFKVGRRKILSQFTQHSFDFAYL